MRWWRPIDDEARSGEMFLLYSKGAYHGLPFPGMYAPSDLNPSQPWFCQLTGFRLYEHVPTHYMPISVPPVWTCEARRADCEWPRCSCDPYTERVLAALDHLDLLDAYPRRPGK